MWRRSAIPFPLVHLALSWIHIQHVLNPIQSNPTRNTIHRDLVYYKHLIRAQRYCQHAENTKDDGSTWQNIHEYLFLLLLMRDFHHSPNSQHHFMKWHICKFAKFSYIHIAVEMFVFVYVIIASAARNTRKSTFGSGFYETTIINELSERGTENIAIIKWIRGCLFHNIHDLNAFILLWLCKTNGL